MEAERPGVCDRLAMKLEWQDCPAGQVIFRQKDPPGNCYVLCEGVTDVYICSQELMPQEGERRKLKKNDSAHLHDVRFGAALYNGEDSRFLSLERFSI
eukprot:Skav234269  [mRNA]  locus=scaffold1464:1040615:1043897:+ [translate_table: standard]